MTAINITDLNNAKLDADTLGAFVNSASATVTTRLGDTVPTLAGLTADFATMLTDLNAEATVTAAVTAKTDAEEARDTTATLVASAQAASLKVLFSTLALGLAATPAGQQFVVAQPFGEGADLYQNVAGVAVWKSAGLIGELMVAEMMRRAITSVYKPIAGMISWHVLAQNGRGCLNPAISTTKILGRNLYAYVHSPRNAGSGPTTLLHNADGPTKTGTASRITFTVTTQSWSLWTSASAPPTAMTGVWDFQAKLVSGADITVKVGNSAQGFTNKTLSSSVWTRIQVPFTTDGSTNWRTMVLQGDGSNLPDFWMDECRVYEGVAADVPLFSAEAAFGGNFSPAIAWPVARASGRLLDNTTTSVLGSGLLYMENYPTPTVFSELTWLVAVAPSVAVTNQQFMSTDTDSVYGTTQSTLAITSAQADGNPDFTSITGFSAYSMVGQGAVILALRVRDLFRQGNVDTIEWGRATTAFSGITAAMLRIGANSGSETAFANTFRMQGQVGEGKVFKTYLSNTALNAEIIKMRAEMELAGIKVAAVPRVLIAMGDSQFASSTGARGPSVPYLLGAAGVMDPNLFTTCLAVGGKTSQQIVSEQLPVALEIAENAAAVDGRQVAFSAFTGTNNQAEIVTDWNNGTASFTNPTGWWLSTWAALVQPVLDKGYPFIWHDALPDGGSPPTNWEAARVALNAVVLAKSLVTPGFYVVKQGSNTNIGTLAATLTGKFDTDHRHLSTTGQVDAYTEALPVYNTAFALG